MKEIHPGLILIKRFPRLFRNRQPRAGASVPAGWLPLATRLFADIDAMLDDIQARRFKVLQVKEKFGSLRVYWSLGRSKATVLDVIWESSAEHATLPPAQPPALFDRIHGRIDAAEHDSRRICQRCGDDEASSQSDQGWLITLCPACRAADLSGNGAPPT